MNAVATVRAQGKINLFLRILAREASGHHALETLFARLDLADDITVRPSAGPRSVDCRGADVGPAESNLAYRAAVAYSDAAGWPGGFAIEIDKRIPVGGGLGGGSADAGAVLRALNALARTPLPSGQLLQIAGTLGADVPFMTLEATWALGWGRGHRLLELAPPPSMPVSLVTFPFGVSSGAAFGWVADSRAGGFHIVEPRALSRGDLAHWDSIAVLASNDFETEVTRRHPVIARSLASARAANPLVAQLSGSGSTVFVISRADSPTPDLGEQSSGTTVLATRTVVSVEDVVVTR